MALHGSMEFDVYAQPLGVENGDRVRYDGYATFTDGPVRFTYSLVSGAPYLVTTNRSSNAQTVQCIPPSTLPFHDMLAALNALTPIPSATRAGNAIECTLGNLFKTSFAGVSYAVCVGGKSGFTAYATAMTIHVTYLDKPVDISTTRLSDGSSCHASANAIEMTPTALALLRGSQVPVSTSRILKEQVHLAMASSSCSCKSTPRPCLFFHGLGNENEEQDVQDTSPHFGWEELVGHTPCCTTVKYAALNTVDYGWTDSQLQKKVCDRALSMSKSSSGHTIKDTILITHSMGGLMFAGALANKKCNLAKSSTWIALSPPMTGSMSSDYLIEYCNGKIDNVLARIVFQDKCPISTSATSVVYKMEKYSDKTMDAAYTAAEKVYRKHVFAAMCSSSYVGNISKYQAKYMIGGTLIKHKSRENDGLVEFQSCAGGISPSKFGTTHNDRFYKCELNHADTAFKTGDGLFKTTVKPVTWFECLL